MKKIINKIKNSFKKFLNTIIFKTLSYLVFFSTLVILSFWILETILERVLYENYQMNNITEINKIILESDLEELDTIFSNNDFGNICVQVYIDNIIYSQYNIQNPGCALNRNLIENYKEEFDRHEGDAISLNINNDKRNVDSVLTEIRRNDSNVYVFTNLENVDAAFSIIDKQIMYILLVLVIFSILIAYFLSHRITNPIRQLTKKAKQFTDGDYNTKFEKSGITEIDNLVDSINYMGNEFKRTDEFRRDLMASVSHDLKTPLTMIKAYSEMVRDLSYHDKEKRDEHLNIIINETERLNVLVNDILTLSKLQCNEEIFNYEEFDINSEINNVIKKFNNFKEKEGYKIKYQKNKKTLVYADKNKINQVLYNLLSNALNYTGKDKTVIVELINKDKSYLINVIDTGKGIDKEELNFIWDKYYKNEKKHQRNNIGTGLGLAIVKNILTKHNFKYGVNSIKKEGTTFYFEIKKRR